ncbi:BRCA1-A complex subunit RAP80 isoform X2 [Engystomops pustulosus]|uniref:BRCA1-A complex subunit RAP80 isoform X2 n=1 Tax=Engystomops pustulosus TaxID=76066 RepID=UPI003AFA3D7C
MSMYHRRKQRFSEGTCRQNAVENEESSSGTAVNVDHPNRTDNEDLSIVISDGDDTELQEESILPKKRRRPPTLRKPSLVKRKITHMTEEEQLALAVKISQQEQTTQKKYTQEEEEELIKKAIEESLHSCQVTDTPISEAEDEVANETSSRKEQLSLNNHNEETHSPKESTLSEDTSKSPVVLLQRLSQDIVESSSVILSPNCKDPVSCIENRLQTPLSPCYSRDYVKFSPAKEVPLSPVFPKRPPLSCRLVPCRLFQEKSASAEKLVDDLDDHCTHCSESPQMDSSVGPTSCSQGESSSQNYLGSTNCLSTDKSKKIDCKDSSSADRSEGRSDMQNQSGSKVHYYWGIPFCPRGVDPSEYTKVILCQLEVYQKHLKSAQRQLLHKMDYGQPIHLADSGQESLKEDTQKSNNPEDAEDGASEDDTQKLEEDEKEDSSDSQETLERSSKRQKVVHSPAQTVLENDHCCSSPSGDKDNAKALFTKRQPSECAGVASVAPGESAVSPTAVRNDRHLMAHTEIAQEEEITVCPETQPNSARQEESDEDTAEVTEKPPESQACISTETFDEEIICLDKMFPKYVACPMCGSNFPRTQIERHAAFCDGTDGQQEMTVLRSRNKLTRKSQESSAVSIAPGDSGKCEKCYLCKSLVPLKDYQVHVDKCLQTAVLETQGSQRLRSNKEYPGSSCGLINMLEQSESLTGTVNNASEPLHLSPPSQEHDDSFGSEQLNLSDSPIRSFVSISEATDCLVDFKKQFSRHPSRRRPSRQGRRRRV